MTGRLQSRADASSAVGPDARGRGGLPRRARHRRRRCAGAPGADRVAPARLVPAPSQRDPRRPAEGRGVRDGRARLLRHGQRRGGAAGRRPVVARDDPERDDDLPRGRDGPHARRGGRRRRTGRHSGDPGRRPGRRPVVGRIDAARRHRSPVTAATTRKRWSGLAATAARTTDPDGPRHGPRLASRPGHGQRGAAGRGEAAGRCREHRPQLPPVIQPRGHRARSTPLRQGPARAPQRTRRPRPERDARPRELPDRRRGAISSPRPGRRSSGRRPHR